ncbi:MAG: L-histidine N(alpha)-methyltransferase [Luminiphilus sp.]|nr:L-histidine N(alpha)-methyltransferase [Luminiphilus sp.]MDG1460879.1 L-histidine N(alpha)-methyltransferase [Luminiphilus sp.]
MISISSVTKNSPSNLRFIQTERPLIDETLEVVASLSEELPRLSPKYFYDSRGSELFEEITALPEYYLTRSEAEIFDRHLAEIAQALGSGDIIIEPGSGNCSKVRPLLTQAAPSAFIPIDIAGDFLWAAAANIALEHPNLAVTAIAADFTQSWTFLEDIPEGRRIVFYPGSTLGNFDPDAQQDFIRQLAEVVGTQGGILLGVDLHKDSATLQRAYDDAAGVTAAFNRNMLAVVNARTGSNFEPKAWRHQARYNSEMRRIEMELVAQSTQSVTIGDQTLKFSEGAIIRTEHSHKFTMNSIRDLAAAGGMTLTHHWLDSHNRFCLALLQSG